MENNRHPTFDAIEGIFSSQSEDRHFKITDKRSQSRRVQIPLDYEKVFDTNINIKYSKQTNLNINEDRASYTAQDNFHSMLPKVIINASASVSNASGRKFNYSVGKIIQPPTRQYKDYLGDNISIDNTYIRTY